MHTISQKNNTGIHVEPVWSIITGMSTVNMNCMKRTLFMEIFLFFVSGCVYACVSVKLLKNLAGLLFHTYDHFFVVNYTV